VQHQVIAGGAGHRPASGGAIRCGARLWRGARLHPASI